jgi:hypothetical protein
MFMFIAGVLCTLGCQYVKRRFGNALKTAWTRIENEADSKLKGE